MNQTRVARRGRPVLRLKAEEPDPLSANLGTATSFQGLVSSIGGLIARRFAIGLFEAGVFPGVH